VVRGTARVTIGGEIKIDNPGKIDLELIEVQSGSYLAEDDIVRVEDDYRRSKATAQAVPVSERSFRISKKKAAPASSASDHDRAARL
jgi:hypothetical protein